ncbi:MAG: GAF and ANTAR domain-containing protein [Actinomycetota bacterium]|nr:GAF and ANTAR domain-containing protein [Actinomycetota bacterium]
MTTREDRIAETFLELADTLVDDFDVIEFLHVLADRSVELLDADAAGIMLGDQRGGLHPVASSTEEARLIELFEHQNNEGPCLDCFRSGEPVALADLETMRASWPAFTVRLEQLGFHAAQAIPMRLRTQVIGALNIFRTSPGVLSESDSRLAQALADVATVGLLQERAVSARDILAEQLQTALNSRIVIEQAKGMIAERAGLQMTEAFQLLRGHARKHGTKLSDVAARVIDGSFHAGPERSPKSASTQPAL